MIVFMQKKPYDFVDQRNGYYYSENNEAKWRLR